jgi:hypothetical protein
MPPRARGAQAQHLHIIAMPQYRTFMATAALARLIGRGDSLNRLTKHRAIFLARPEFGRPQGSPLRQDYPLDLFANIFSLIRADDAGEAATSALA